MIANLLTFYGGVVFMGKIVFQKHPGDLLKIINFEKRQVILTIGNITLLLSGGIKLTPEKYFLLPVEIPSDKVRRTAVIEKLNQLKINGEIYDYQV